MSTQTARNVLINLLETNVFDGSVKTSIKIAIEAIDDAMITEWSQESYGLTLREYLGYSEYQYNKYILKMPI